MLSLLTVLSLHVPPENYLRCEDFDWLANGLARTELLSVSQKFDILTKWMDHTDPACFDNKDAHD